MASFHMQEVAKIEGIRIARTRPGYDLGEGLRKAFSTRSGGLSWTRVVFASYFVLFQLLDLASTQFGLSLGIAEANGLAAQIIGAAGRPGLALFKLAITGLFLVVLLKLSVRFRRIWAAVYVADVLMTLVVAFNALNLWLFFAAA